MIPGSVNGKQIKCEFILETWELQRRKWNAKGLIAAKYLFWLKQLMGSMMMRLWTGNSVFWEEYPPRKKSLSRILFVEGGEKNWQKAQSDLPRDSLGEHQEPLLLEEKRA